MAAARSWRPRRVDTNGLLAPNFGQGPLPVSRPKPPLARGDHDGSIQTDYWPPTSGKVLCRSADRSRRSLVETTTGRYKRIIGPQLRARSFAGQQTEAAARSWRPRRVDTNGLLA